MLIFVLYTQIYTYIHIETGQEGCDCTIENSKIEWAQGNILRKIHERKAVNEPAKKKVFHAHLQ